MLREGTLLYGGLFVPTNNFDWCHYPLVISKSAVEGRPSSVPSVKLQPSFSHHIKNPRTCSVVPSTHHCRRSLPRARDYGTAPKSSRYKVVYGGWNMSRGACGNLNAIVGL